MNIDRPSIENAPQASAVQPGPQRIPDHAHTSTPEGAPLAKVDQAVLDVFAGHGPDRVVDLTPLEKSVLGKMRDYLPATREEFDQDPAQFAMVIQDFGKDLNRQQLGGVLSSLVQKGYITTDDVNDEYSAFYPADFDRVKAAPGE